MELQRPILRNESPRLAAGPYHDAPASGPAPPSLDVFITSGVQFGHFPVAGLTVGRARNRLSTHLNLSQDADARAVVDGQEVSDDYVLRAGQVLSLIRKAGVKG